MPRKVKARTTARRLGLSLLGTAKRMRKTGQSASRAGVIGGHRGSGKRIRKY